MLGQPLLVVGLLAGSGLGAALKGHQEVDVPDEGVTYNEFMLSDIHQETDVDPWKFLPMASLSSNETETSHGSGCYPVSLTCPSGLAELTFGVPQSQSRINEHACRIALDHWHLYADEKRKIKIKRNHCKAITFGCCRSVVCVLKRKHKKISLDEIIGRSWTLLKSRCHLEGGVWHPEGSDSIIQVNAPSKAQCNVKPVVTPPGYGKYQDSE